VEKFPVPLNEDEPVVLYGIGQKTGEVIKTFPALRVVGLLDQTQTGSVFFGKKVLTEDEVCATGVKKIIIVARRGNTRIIFRRIENFCREHNIEVFDIAGGSYPEKATAFDFSKYSGITPENLRRKIDAADVISFDVFDTLVIRNVLYPSDVFYFGGEEFARARISAEKKLSENGKIPNIYDIYKTLAAFPFSAEDEIAAEEKALAPRTETAAFIAYAKEKGKKVFLTSDMYLPKEVIRKLLLRFDIDITEKNIIVSCDEGKTKEGGLFEVLKKRIGEGKILHIGDSYEGDILAAKRQGVFDTFFIPSVLEMLEDSYARELLRFDKTPADRKMIGEFAANALRDPFLFAKTNGKFAPESLGETASVFIAPLVYIMFCNIVKIAEKENIKKILLGARDGYLISKIYDRLSGKFPMPEMDYFLISRALSVLAAIKDENDIKEAMNLPFNGTAEELLSVRFAQKKLLPRFENETDLSFILRHGADIIKTAAGVRGRYLSYIEKFDINTSEKIGFFDLVSSGTCQKALAAITKFNLFGIYIIALSHSPGYKKEVPVEAVFGKVNPYKKSYSLMENYFLLENILPSPEPTIADFDPQGEPLFIADNRTAEQLRNLAEIQESVIHYAAHSEISPKEAIEIDKNIPDIIFSCINPEYFEDKSGYFAAEMLYDEFVNRKFGV
jgi:HAD superfamily hydrolase (TIGR01549 family)